MGLIKVQVFSSVKHPEWGNLDVVVYCFAYLENPGKIVGSLENCYPPEDADIEIDKVVIDGGKHDGKEISNDLIDFKDIKDDAMSEARDSAMDDYFAAWEAKRDAWKEEQWIDK